MLFTAISMCYCQLAVQSSVQYLMEFTKKDKINQLKRANQLDVVMTSQQSFQAVLELWNKDSSWEAVNPWLLLFDMTTTTFTVLDLVDHLYRKDCCWLPQDRPFLNLFLSFWESETKCWICKHSKNSLQWFGYTATFLRVDEVGTIAHDFGLVIFWLTRIGGKRYFRSRWSGTLLMKALVWFKLLRWRFLHVYDPNMIRFALWNGSVIERPSLALC